MEAYDRDLQEVARLAESLGDQRTLAHLRWREAYTHRWFCRYAKARKAAEDGVRLSQAAADPSLEALCQREVGRAARATGDYGQAQAALEQALHLFVDLDDGLSAPAPLSGSGPKGKSALKPKGRFGTFLAPLW